MTDNKIIVSVAGVPSISLPEGATEEAIRTAIADYRTTPEFDSRIDKKAGAPARVRMLVGSAPSKDRLEAPRRLYSFCPYS